VMDHGVRASRNALQQGVAVSGFVQQEHAMLLRSLPWISATG
jgi:hypothetical protein